MFSHRACKIVMCATVSLVALCSTTRADNGYAPYYNGQDPTHSDIPLSPAPSVVTASPSVTTLQPPVFATSEVRPQPPGALAPPPVLPAYEAQGTLQYAPTPAPIKTGAPLRPLPATRTPVAPLPKSVDLGTRSGFEAGLQGSNYHYQEHLSSDHQFMREDGYKIGLTGSGTAKFAYGTFLTGEARLAYSKNSYFSDPTGKIQSFADDLLGEGRVLAGKDIFFRDTPTARAVYDISPYFGIGGRELYNDASAVTGGYRRDSEYFYVPLGLTQRFRAFDDARISVNAEYDLLLLGRESTYLNDVSNAAPNATNDQNHGYGVRGSVMYEWNSWSAGPFINYWNINSSVPSVWASSISSCSPLCEVTEPHNQTLEYGGQVRYHFN